MPPDPRPAPARPSPLAWLCGALAMAALWTLAPAETPGQVAYIDPASSSFVVQAILAILAAAAVTFKTWWVRVRALFGAAPEEDDAAPTDRDA